MSSDLQRYYELLSVSPGASREELKAAHRDMAKVWHPDRFGHDPRLQLKAQEKLKEINEAFDILISGRIPRPQDTPRKKAEETSRTIVRVESSVAASSFRWQWAALPIVLFVLVFGFTLRSQLNKVTSPAPVATPETDTAEQQRPVVASSKSEMSREKGTDSKKDSETQVPATSEIQPMATTTVTIDSTSGLLARADCPSKTRMSYPSGNEPHSYCALPHQQATQSEVTQETTKTSRVKSLTKKIATKLNGETKSEDWSRQD